MVVECYTIDTLLPTSIGAQVVVLSRHCLRSVRAPRVAIATPDSMSVTRSCFCLCTSLLLVGHTNFKGLWVRLLQSLHSAVGLVRNHHSLRQCRKWIRFHGCAELEIG